MRDTIVEIVQRRFPTLVELAQKRVEHMQRLDQLKQLNVDLSTAPNQTSARRILKRPAVD